MSSHGTTDLTGVPLEGVPGMHFGPVNELGVVALFALLSKRLGFSIERIQREFPDCLARRRTARGWETVRIEFEFKARSFKAHGHVATKCDIIVCWENDWTDPPKGLEILDLRRRVEPRRVWLQAVRPQYWDALERRTAMWWSLPRLAKKGDLLLFWHTVPHSYLGHVAEVKENATAKGSHGWRWGAKIKVRARLESPVELPFVKANLLLRRATFHTGNYQGRFDVTPWWAELGVVPEAVES